MAFQCPGCDKTFFAFILFLIFYEASEKMETERNLSWLFNVKAGIKRFLFAFISFLIFHEASKKLKTKRNLALTLFLTFHEASEKPGNWKKSLMAF